MMCTQQTRPEIELGSPIYHSRADNYYASWKSGSLTAGLNFLTRSSIHRNSVTLALNSVSLTYLHSKAWPNVAVPVGLRYRGSSVVSNRTFADPSYFLDQWKWRVARIMVDRPNEEFRQDDFRFSERFFLYLRQESLFFLTLCWIL